MDVEHLTCIPLDEIRAAAERLQGKVLRTPLVRLNMDVPGKDIYLKLECLQPAGSYKLRSALSAMLSLPPAQLTSSGVYTASAGNYAQGVALAARQLNMPCHVIVPDTAPLVKTAAIAALGAHLLRVPYSDWWKVMLTHTYEGMEGHFLHAVINRAGIAGAGTIGLEIAEDLPQVDTVVMPYGGGSLSTGVASALRSVCPHAAIHVCEVAGAAPLTASRSAGRPVTLTEHRPSFADGIAGRAVFSQMWSLVSSLIGGVSVVTERQICDAIRLLVERNRVVAEGAGAAPLAAALTHDVLDGTIVCLVSGGNIDVAKLAQILQGDIPTV